MRKCDICGKEDMGLWHKNVSYCIECWAKKIGVKIEEDS